MKRYQVKRHSGRSGTEFRTVLDTDDRAKADRVYNDISIALRQGAVHLVVAGTVASSTSAPRLRSRW